MKRRIFINDWRCPRRSILHHNALLIGEQKRNVSGHLVIYGRKIHSFNVLPFTLNKSSLTRNITLIKFL
jgi:hypothetical protein